MWILWIRSGSGSATLVISIHILWNWADLKSRLYPVCRHYDRRNIHKGLCMKEQRDCDVNGERDCKGHGEGSARSLASKKRRNTVNPNPPYSTRHAKNGCCYITVDSATSALQNGACIYLCISKKMHYKKPFSYTTAQWKVWNVMKTTVHHSWLSGKNKLLIIAY